MLKNETDGGFPWWDSEMAKKQWRRLQIVELYVYAERHYSS